MFTNPLRNIFTFLSSVPSFTLILHDVVLRTIVDPEVHARDASQLIHIYVFIVLRIHHVQHCNCNIHCHTYIHNYLDKSLHIKIHTILSTHRGDLLNNMKKIFREYTIFGFKNFRSTRFQITNFKVQELKSYVRTFKLKFCVYHYTRVFFCFLCLQINSITYA